MPNLMLNRYLSHGPPRKDMFGEFFEATDTQSNEAMQVKRLRGSRPVLDLPKVVRCLQKIQSEALPAPLAAETAEDGRVVVVIPHVSGERFTEIIREFRAGRAWGRHHVLRMVATICEALGALHQTGLYHGGINPEAIVVRDGSAGSVTVLPFCVFSALRTHEYLEGQADEVGYVSQEQLRGLGGSKGDIYSVGMLLYRCFASSRPFAVEDSWAISEAIMLGDLRPFEMLSAANDNACGDMIAADLAQLREIVSKALQRDPGARYASIEAMRTAIRQVAERLDPYHIAVRLFLTEHYDAAIPLLEETIRERENVDSANLLLGRIYGLFMGNYDKGIIHLKRAHLANPRSFRPFEYQAQLHEQQGSHSLAVTEYETAILKAEEQHAYHDQERLRLGLANVLAIRNEPGDLSHALTELEQILSRNPWLLSAHASRARIYRSMGQVSEAIMECFTARDKISQMPSIDLKQQGEVFDLLGGLFYQIGQLDRALTFYQRAIQVDPGRSDTHNTLAGIYRATGDRDKALQHWLRSLAIKADQVGVLAAIAQLLKENRG